MLQVSVMTLHSIYDAKLHASRIQLINPASIYRNNYFHQSSQIREIIKYAKIHGYFHAKLHFYPLFLTSLPFIIFNLSLVNGRGPPSLQCPRAPGYVVTPLVLMSSHLDFSHFIGIAKLTCTNYK